MMVGGGEETGSLLMCSPIYYNSHMHQFHCDLETAPPFRYWQETLLSLPAGGPGFYD